MNAGDKPKINAGDKPKITGRVLMFLLIAGAIGIGYAMFGQHLSLQNLARQEAALTRFRDEHLLLVYFGVFVIYAAVTGFSLPGATGMTLIIGSYLGFWPALGIISFASTSGATIAFLLSRYFFRDSIERRFGERLTTFNRALEREGAWYLLTLRLIPAVPFFVINLVMGLTKMRVWTYWWVSQLGMLPGTCVYVFMGSRFSFETIAQRGAAGFFRWDVFIALGLLALFPLAVRWLIGSKPAADPGDLEGNLEGNEDQEAGDDDAGDDGQGRK